MNDYQNIPEVDKEIIHTLSFPEEDIRLTKDELSLRLAALERANALGNMEHHKVKIYFSDDQGMKFVHTTIWGITDKAVLLKQNTILPINRIHKLEI